MKIWKFALYQFRFTLVASEAGVVARRIGVARGGCTDWPELNGSELNTLSEAGGCVSLRILPLYPCSVIVAWQNDSNINP